MPLAETILPRRSPGPNAHAKCRRRSFRTVCYGCRLCGPPDLPTTRAGDANSKRLATANAQSAFQLGRWQLVTLGPDKALSWLQGLPKNIRSTPLIGVLLADSYSALKRWMDLEDLVRWTDWHEAEALRLAFLARAQAQQDKVSRSEETWQLALAAARSRPGQLVSLAKMARADGRDVREVLWLIAEQDPAQTWARKELYEAYLKEKNSGQMLRMMELILKEDPDDQTAKYNVAGLLMVTERQLDRAARLAQELYKSDSKNLRNAVLYAYALKLRGEAGKGAAILGSREDLDQLENDGRAYYALILTACGRTDEARSFALLVDRQQLPPELRASLDRTLEDIAHTANAKAEHF